MEDDAGLSDFLLSIGVRRLSIPGRCLFWHKALMARVDFVAFLLECLFWATRGLLEANKPKPLLRVESVVSVSAV